MDVRDLILATDPTTNEPVTPKARKAPAKPVWEVVLTDACDGAIRKTTPRTSKLLVLLMSKGQFYIKDEKTNAVEKLDESNLATFMKGCDSVIKPVPWCTEFTSSKKDAAKFVRCVYNENFQWLARRNLHNLAYSSSKYYANQDSSYRFESERKMHDNPLNKAVRMVVEDILGEETAERLSKPNAHFNGDEEERAYRALQRQYHDELGSFSDKWGIDLTRDYLREFITAPFVGVKMPQLSRFASDLYEVTNFEPRRFMEYILHDSVRQGFGMVDTGYGYYGNSSRISDFISMWSDTLKMQARQRNRVYDKYPDELESMHRRLSFKSQLMRIRIDTDKFAAHSERLSKLMKQDEWYIIRPPYNKQDMLDEAAQQANCLATYVEAYADDKTDIYFLRTALEPEKSLVTVEVRDGRIRQAYAACNRRPGNDELKWLAKWAKENGIEMVDADSQHPMAV